MEIVLIKRLLANGLSSPESIRLERQLRGSDYWSASEHVEVAQSACGAASLLVRNGQETEVFTDFTSFKRYVQPQAVNSAYTQAACW